MAETYFYHRILGISVNNEYAFFSFFSSWFSSAKTGNYFQVNYQLLARQDENYFTIEFDRFF